MSIESIKSMHAAFNASYEALKGKKAEEIQSQKPFMKLVKNTVAQTLSSPSSTLSERDLEEIQAISSEINAKYEKIKARTQKTPKKEEVKTPQAPSRPSVVHGVVGFGNAAANCWINSLLQMIINTPSLGRIYFAVMRAELDNIREALYRLENELTQRKAFLPQLEPGIAEAKELLAEAKKAVRAAQKLGKKGKEELAQAKEQEKYAKEREKVVTDGRNAAVKETKECQKKVAKLQKKEEAAELLNGVFHQYHEYLEQEKPIPDSLSQGVREALNTLFKIHGRSSSRHEDPTEALTAILSRYTDSLNNPMGFLAAPLNLPPLLSQRWTETTYQRTDAEQQEYDPEQEEHEVTKRGSGAYTCNMNLSLAEELGSKRPNKTIHMTTLLKNFSQNTKDRPFIDREGVPHQVVCKGEKYVHAPEEFLLTLDRFVTKWSGIVGEVAKMSKISNPVSVKRFMHLPATSNMREEVASYELTSFIEHLGGLSAGHYVAYRKIGRSYELVGNHFDLDLVKGPSQEPTCWVKCNDESVSACTEEEIDQILSKSTTYIHHYERTYDFAPPEVASDDESEKKSVAKKKGVSQKKSKERLEKAKEFRGWLEKTSKSEKKLIAAYTELPDSVKKMIVNYSSEKKLEKAVGSKQLRSFLTKEKEGKSIMDKVIKDLKKAATS